MKKLLTILFILIGFFSFAQDTLPKGVPTQNIKGWAKASYYKTDSAMIVAVRDTLWHPRFAGTVVEWQHAGKDTSLWQFDGVKWSKLIDSKAAGFGLRFDTTCNCYVVDTASLQNIFVGGDSISINNIYNNSIVGATVVNDSCVAICTGNASCDTICSTITGLIITSVTFVNDSTLVVCGYVPPDTLTQVCDTLHFNPTPVYIFQNWLRQIAPGIHEFGSNSPSYSDGLMLNHNTYTHTNYYKMFWNGYTVYDAPHNFLQDQSFQNSTAITSFISAGDYVNGFPRNGVRLLVNYSDSIVTAGTQGYMGTARGYSVGTNWVGHGTFGTYLDNNNSKSTGIFFHTLDSSNTDGVTIYAAPDLGGSAPVLNGALKNYKSAIFRTNKDITFPNYPNTRFDGKTANAFYADDDGNVLYGGISGSGSTDSTIVNIYIAGDTIFMCNAAHACDTILLSQFTIVNFQNVYVLGDSAIVVCDSLNSCDTLALSGGTGVDRGFFDPNQLSTQNTIHQGNQKNFSLLDVNKLTFQSDSLLLLGLPVSSSPLDSVLVRTPTGIVKYKSVSALGLRFGVFGEDDEGSQTRSFDGNNNNFYIFKTKNFQLHSASLNNGDFYIERFDGSPYAEFKLLGIDHSSTVLVDTGYIGFSSTIGRYNFANVPNGGVAADSFLVITPTGDIKRRNVPLAGITADNGATMSTSSNVQFGSTTDSGSPFLHTTFLNAAAYDFNITRTGGYRTLTLHQSDGVYAFGNNLDQGGGYFIKIDTVAHVHSMAGAGIVFFRANTTTGVYEYGDVTPANNALTLKIDDPGALVTLGNLGGGGFANGTRLEIDEFRNWIKFLASRTTFNGRAEFAKGANVASTTNMTLGNDGNVFRITGTTTIENIVYTNWQAGSEIILIFDGSLTVKNNTASGANTAPFLLAGGADFSATANDVLKVVYDGTNFIEVSRSVN